MGVDVDDDSVADKSGEGVVDLMSTKESALRLAVDAAVTVLRVRVDYCCVAGVSYLENYYVLLCRLWSTIIVYRLDVVQIVCPQLPLI